MLSDFLVLDVETTGRDDVRRFVKPDSRLVDSKKIAASIEERCGKLAVDINGARIVCLGFISSKNPDTPVVMSNDACAEVDMLAALWFAWSQLGTYKKVIGYNARRFDVPLVTRRSQLLKVKHPNLSVARYGKGDVRDLYEDLCFDDTYGTPIVPRDLETFAWQFGIELDPEDQNPCDGADIPRLAAEGRWDLIRAHNRADLLTTKALAERLGVISAVQAVGV